MLLAVIGVAAVSIYYMRPWTALQPAAASTPVRHPPVLRSGIFASYAFVSTALGWTVDVTTSNSAQGSYWVYRTVDGGRHWERQLAGDTSLTYATAFSLRFWDVRTGYVVAGDPLSLYRTRDGGEHWKVLELPWPELDWVDFIDASTGFAVGRAKGDPASPVSVFVTRDSGDTWAPVPHVPINSAAWPRARSASEFWSGATAEGPPFVYLTIDGGGTWSRRDLPVERDLPISITTGVDFVPHSELVIVWEYAEGPGPFHFYSTLDRGGSWTALTLPRPGGDFGGIAYLDETHWWAIQGRDLYKTNNGGRSWLWVALLPVGLRLVQVMDQRHAWAELDEGYGTELVFTSDGGQHWTPTSVPAAK